MTRVEYDLLREQMPELKLPTWWYVMVERARVGQAGATLGQEASLPCTRDELIAHRCAILLGGELDHGMDDMPKGTL